MLYDTTKGPAEIMSSNSVFKFITILKIDLFRNSFVESLINMVFQIILRLIDSVSVCVFKR